MGSSCPLPLHSSTVLGTHPFSDYTLFSIRGKALAQEVLSLVEKGAVELAPLPSPGFYSCLFIVMKASGSWRPIIDLSTLKLSLFKSPFKMETLKSVPLSVRRGDWMMSLDLKDACLQVPVHPDSHKFLRFIALGQVFQFKALCFSLSMAPQVFTWVMAPVSAFLHRSGIRIHRYFDNWLLQASSRDLVLQTLDSVLHLCRSLGIMINVGKSNLFLSQRIVYLGMRLDSLAFGASPSQPRVKKLLLIAEEFLSSVACQHHLLQVLLGDLCLLIPLVPGSRLHMRSLQFCLHSYWDCLDVNALVR